MGRWKVKPWECTLLLSMLFLFFLILVLPQVDLPDTAFHGNTAPIVIHSRYTSPPAALAMSETQLRAVVKVFVRRDGRSETPARPLSDSLPTLNGSLRC